MRSISAVRGGRLLAALAGFPAVAACGDDPPPTPAVVVAKDPLAIPDAVGSRDPTTVAVELTVEELIGELGPGVKTPVWTFNGTVPGPLIRVREGDTVALTLTNSPGNAEPHDIDLHAFEAPGGGSLQTEVRPGETRELRFEVQEQGAFLYHCSAEGKPWEHLVHGMYGIIVVEPAGGLEPVDIEAYVAQSEWYLEAQRGGEEAEEEAEDEGEEHVPHDVMKMDEEAARRSEPSLFTFNGHRSALTSTRLFGERLQLPAGGRARFFFANAGPNLPSSFHVMGGILDRIYTGAFSAPPTSEETFSVPPGSAAVLELTIPTPGAYAFVDHALFHAEQGAMGLLRVAEPSE